MLTIFEVIVVLSILTFGLVVSLASTAKLHCFSVVQPSVSSQLGCGVDMFSASSFHWAIKMRKQIGMVALGPIVDVLIKELLIERFEPIRVRVQYRVNKAF